MWILVIFILICIVGLLLYLKNPAFRDWISRISTPSTTPASPKRIASLEQILEQEKKKTADLQSKAEKVKSDREKANEIETAIKEERKKQTEATDIIKG